MAKDMVTLAFIFASVFTVLSPTIDVTKAEIVEKPNLKPLSEGEMFLATDQVKQAPSRRYGPWIQQPIFSFPDEGYCSIDNPLDPSCDDCDRSCKERHRTYGHCVGIVYGFRTCRCYFKCSPW